MLVVVRHGLSLRGHSFSAASLLISRQGKSLQCEEKRRPEIRVRREVKGADAIDACLSRLPRLPLHIGTTGQGGWLAGGVIPNGHYIILDLFKSRICAKYYTACDERGLPLNECGVRRVTSKGCPVDKRSDHPWKPTTISVSPSH